MRTLVLLILVLFGALSLPGKAQTMELTRRAPATYTLADLFNRADRVVLARVTAADTAAYDMALYKVQVIEAFKGASNGEMLFVGPFVKAEVGSSYFFFLRSVPAPMAPRSKASTGFGTVSYSRVFDDGDSVMLSANQCFFPGKDPAQHCAVAVHVCLDHIVLPGSLTTYPGNAGASSNCPWVRQDAFMTALGDIVQANR
ncbi:MAG: hypothetical protein WBF42_10365 [Terracidiphilus sp.]